MPPALPPKWELYLRSGDSLAGRTPQRTSERPENMTTHWRGVWRQVSECCTPDVGFCGKHAKFKANRRWKPALTEVVLVTTCLTTITEALFLWSLNTTAHSWRSRATKSAHGVRSAHCLQPQDFCHTHARLTCSMSTGKQRRSTRLINAQCELSEKIWGSSVSVKRRVRSNTERGETSKSPKLLCSSKIREQIQGEDALDTRTT